MSGIYFHEYVPDALAEGDSFDEQKEFLFQQLERNWKGQVELLKIEASHWKQRFEMYERHCERALQNTERMGLNALGELQGNVDRFDTIAIRITAIEDMLDGIRKILYPEEKRAPIKSAGADRPRRRKAARKGE